VQPTVYLPGLGDIASEEVMVQLLKHKCLPILLYAFEVCNLDKRVLQSLDFTVNRFFMKLFKTSNIEISNYSADLEQRHGRRWTFLF